MSRAPVYHAAKSIPKSHVSFNSSKVQKPHHTISASSITFVVRSKWGDWRASIIAIANNMIWSISFGKDMGTGNETSFIWIR